MRGSPDVRCVSAVWHWHLRPSAPMTVVPTVPQLSGERHTEYLQVVTHHTNAGERNERLRGRSRDSIQVQVAVWHDQNPAFAAARRKRM